MGSCMYTIQSLEASKANPENQSNQSITTTKKKKHIHDPITFKSKKKNQLPPLLLLYPPTCVKTTTRARVPDFLGSAARRSAMVGMSAPQPCGVGRGGVVWWSLIRMDVCGFECVCVCMRVTALCCDGVLRFRWMCECVSTHAHLPALPFFFHLRPHLELPVGRGLGLVGEDVVRVGQRLWFYGFWGVDGFV